MNPTLRHILDLLDVERIEENLYRGRNAPESQHVFGGQVLAQAIAAANRTIDDARQLHSIHAYFLRPGDWNLPILYQVDRIRDGKSFSTRRVVAIQHGRAIFHLSASFQSEESGPDHQMPMPEVPQPESLPTFEERMGAELDTLPPDVRKWLTRDRPIETRAVEWVNPFKPIKRAPRQHVWIRASGTLPPGPLLLHQCILAYASDLTLLDTATLPHAIPWNDARYMMASLDHAMWFHR
ncbi:MAG TPA: acyl-CoA thioesterase II, partial [Pseudomonadales bacterium]